MILPKEPLPFPFPFFKKPYPIQRSNISTTVRTKGGLGFIYKVTIRVREG